MGEEVIDHVAGPAVGAEELRIGHEGVSEPDQEAGPALKAGYCVSLPRLETSGQLLDGQVAQPVFVNLRGIVSAAREEPLVMDQLGCPTLSASHLLPAVRAHRFKHLQARYRNSFRSPIYAAILGALIAPLSSGPGIEQHADKKEINQAATFLRVVYTLGESC